MGVSQTQPQGTIQGHSKLFKDSVAEISIIACLGTQQLGESACGHARLTQSNCELDAQRSLLKPFVGQNAIISVFPALPGKQKFKCIFGTSLSKPHASKSND